MNSNQFPCRNSANKSPTGRGKGTHIYMDPRCSTLLTTAKQIVRFLNQHPNVVLVTNEFCIDMNGLQERSDDLESLIREGRLKIYVLGILEKEVEAGLCYMRSHKTLLPKAESLREAVETSKMPKRAKQALLNAWEFIGAYKSNPEDEQGAQDFRTKLELNNVPQDVLEELKKLGGKIEELKRWKKVLKLCREKKRMDLFHEYYANGISDLLQQLGCDGVLNVDCTSYTLLQK